MSSQIDPRLYGSVTHNHSHFTQPTQHHRDHSPHQNQQYPQPQRSSHPPAFYPPPQSPHNLPPIDQLHNLPGISQHTLPPPQQHHYYPRQSLPSPSNHLLHLSEHSHAGSPASIDQYTDGANSPATGVHDANDPKRSRACEACRGLKVRCDQDPNDPNIPCKRCAKAKRQCVITAPSRKRQKKTDSRVAELERKIDALTASLNAQKKDPKSRTSRSASTSAPSSPADSVQSRKTPSPVQSPQADRKRPVLKETWQDHTESAQIAALPSHVPATPQNTEQKDSCETAALAKKRRRSDEPKRQPTPPAQTKEDAAPKRDHAPPVKRRPSMVHPVVRDQTPFGAKNLDAQIDAVIDRKTAERIFDHYIAEMAQHFPVIVFPPGTKAAHVRSTKTTLFLAILVAASVGNTDLELQTKLNKVAMDRFADCIIRNGEKSLELVQALMVSTVWYRPPRRYEQMNFYQYTHIAAVMAIDIGMGKRSKTWRMAQPQNDHVKSTRPVLISESIEGRRTWLGCYFLCSNISMCLRRPNLVRWSNYMDECIEVLETSEAALPSDKVLCQHVLLQHINEEIGNQFSMDDPSAPVSISDAKVQMSVKAFERALDDWSLGVPKKLINPALEFSKHVSALYVHEVAMHNNHNVDDFRAPFTEESIKAASGQSAILSPAHSSALSECVTAVHGIFNAYFAFDLVTVRALPIFYFVRIAYALVVLVKLYFAVTAPNSEVGKIISPERLRITYYIDRLLGVFHTIDKEGAFRPAQKFLMILEKLKDWFQQDKGTKASAASDREPSRIPQKERTLLPGRIRQVQPQHQANGHLPQAQQQGMSLQQQQHMQHGQHRHPQHQQPQNGNGINPNHSHLSNPLHFLSEVATNNAANAVGDASWYQPGPQQQQSMNNTNNMQGMDLSGLDLEYMGMSSGFEQAMDMALVPGQADGDISSFFIADPLFSFGMGMDPMDGSGMYGNGW